MSRRELLEGRSSCFILYTMSKPLVVEGLKLIISIVVEHIQMMGIVENFSVVR